MKKLLLSFVILVLFTLPSCVTVQPMEEVSYATGYDFSDYTDKGFLFTPEQYLGEYQSIGMITVTLWPSVTKESRIQQNRATGSSHSTQEWAIGELNVKKAIDDLYTRATDMGANAITRFQVESTYQMNGTLRVPGVEVSGFAIRITE